MKTKPIILLTSLSFLLLFVGCKSEAEEKLDEACSKDMSNRDNKDACFLALMTNCGGFLGLPAVEKCAKNKERSECSSMPSYCISNYSKAFGSED